MDKETSLSVINNTAALLDRLRIIDELDQEKDVFKNLRTRIYPAIEKAHMDALCFGQGIIDIRKVK